MAAQFLQDAPERDQILRDPPFDKLTVKEQHEVAKKARMFYFANDEILCAQGQRVSYVSFVCAGLVKLSSTAAQGKECVLHIIRPHNVLDIGVLFYEGGLPYSAISLAPGVLCQIENTLFLRLLSKNFSFGQRCMRLMAARQRLFMNKLVASQGRISVVCRVSSWLLHRSRMEQTDELHFDIGRELMARLLGVTRESLSRELSRLAELGYIAVNKRCITLLDRASLEKLARM